MPPRGEPLDGRHLGAVDVEREDQTCRGGPAVQQDRAGAAVPRVAGEVRPREAEVPPEELEERARARDLAAHLAAVHRELEGIALRHDPITRWRAPAGRG